MADDSDKHLNKNGTAKPTHTSLQRMLKSNAARADLDRKIAQGKVRGQKGKGG